MSLGIIAVASTEAFRARFSAAWICSSFSCRRASKSLRAEVFRSSLCPTKWLIDSEPTIRAARHHSNLSPTALLVSLDSQSQPALLATAELSSPHPPDAKPVRANRCQVHRKNL